MEIVATESEWTSVDSDNWAKFLDTPTGRRVLPKLAETAPRLLTKGEDNEIFIRSGTLLGYQESLRNLLEMAHPAAPPASPSDPYPSLENDAAWDDGKKLIPNPLPQPQP